MYVTAETPQSQDRPQGLHISQLARQSSVEVMTEQTAGGKATRGSAATATLTLKKLREN